MKKIVSLLLALTLVAGCADSEPTSSQTEAGASVGLGTSDDPEPTPPSESQNWADCDSEDSQPLTQVFDKEFRVFAPSCPTDRTLPSAALSTSQIEPSETALCMLEENSYSRNTYGDYITSAFPRAITEQNWPSQVELTLVVVPMDWPDFPGKGSPMRLISPAVEFTENYFKVFTRGKVSLTWRIYEDWITAPDASGNYYVSDEDMQDEHGAMKDKAREYFPKVISFTDPIVDYSNADLVLYVWPEDQDLFTQYILWNHGENGIGPFNTNEGPINQAFTGGGYHFEDGNGGLGPFWTHEMFHAFGLPDLNWTDLDGLRNDGSYLPGPFNGYDLMAGFDATRTISGWLMFLADWLAEEEVYCINPDTFNSGSFTLSPISEESSDLKTVMIPVNERFQIVIESRRISEFDVAQASKTRSREGVLVYVIDGTKGQGEGTQVLIAPPGRGLYKYSIEGSIRMDQLDGMFYQGNTVDIAGYRITVNESLEAEDIISISRLGPGEAEFGNYVCITEENRQRTRQYEEYCPLSDLLPNP